MGIGVSDDIAATADEPGGAADADALLAKLKRWFRDDFDHQAEWRRAAREDFAFTSGDQLDEKDKARLREMNRPVIVMNRIEPVVDSVSGSEVANRQEVQFLPRTMGEVQANEVLTAAAKWFRDQCDAEDEESDAFRDTVVCGMGWTETRLDYEDEPDGAPKIERIDPLEMVWDSAAKKRNLTDMRRLFHVRRDIPIDEARALCPGEQFEDSDYDASWVDLDEGDAKKPHENDGRFYDKQSDGAGDAGGHGVTLVQAQWWERLPVWLVVDPTNPDNILTLTREAFLDLEARLKLAGGALNYTTSTRKVYRQAFIGRVLLEIGDAPCREHFSFKCITGKRDRNANTWYGLVRAMKDPQRWANKWMSQTMHIMNTTAKGGIAAERGAFFDDEADGEASWAKQDAVTYLRPGALSGAAPKFIQKPTSPFPESSFNLMQFAINAIRDVSGVNVEILGMQTAAGQAASLDLQRKQAAMTILQPLFDSLRRYRKEQGRLLLYLIENYLSDGRLIRIVGPDQAGYVPLVRAPGINTYDVIVDEAPTSPNQKEATWSMLTQLLPVIGKLLPPATWLALMKYSPLPTSAQKDISDSLAQQQQQPHGPSPEEAKANAELALANTKAQAEIANHRAMTEARIESLRREAAAKQDIELRRAQAENLRDLMAAPAPLVDGAVAAPDASALVMSMMDAMRRDMAELAAAVSAPKCIIRDPQSGEITAVVPMQGN